MTKLDKNGRPRTWIQNKKGIFLSVIGLTLPGLLDIHPAEAGPFFDAVARNDWKTVEKLVESGDCLDEKGGSNGNTSVLTALVKHRNNLISETLNEDFAARLYDKRGLEKAAKPIVAANHLIRTAIEKGAHLHIDNNEKFSTFSNMLDDDFVPNVAKIIWPEVFDPRFMKWYLENINIQPMQKYSSPTLHESGKKCIDQWWDEDQEELFSGLFGGLRFTTQGDCWADLLELSIQKKILDPTIKDALFYATMWPGDLDRLGLESGTFTFNLPEINARLQMAKILLRNGAKADVLNDKGRSPLDVVETLLKHVLSGKCKISPIDFFGRSKDKAAFIEKLNEFIELIKSYSGR